MELLFSILGALIIYLLFRMQFSYFSLYEFLTGLPSHITYKVIFTKFSIPLIISFLLGLVLSYFGISFSNDLKFGLGAISGLFLVLPALADNRYMPEKIISMHKTKELRVIYLLVIVSFTLLGFLGFLISEYVLSYSSVSEFLPSKTGLKDGIWSALVIIISGMIIKKLSQVLNK